MSTTETEFAQLRIGVAGNGPGSERASLRPAFVRWRFFGVFLWLISALIGSPSAAGAATQDGNRVTFSWLTACDDSRVQSFSVDVFDTGEVHYQGDAGVKTLGSLHAQIRRSAADNIRRAAKTFVRAQPERDREVRNCKRRTFCLEVSIYAGGSLIKSRSDPGDARAARLALREVERRVNPKEWACPARAGASDALFRPRGYCDELAAFTLQIGGETSCDVTQTIYVYSDGTIHNVAYRTHTRAAGRDDYYKIDPVAVTGMVDVINLFPVSTTQIEDVGDIQTIYSRGQPEDIQRIKTQLSTLASIEWAPSSGATGCDEYPGPPSSISLRPDLDAAVKKAR